MNVKALNTPLSELGEGIYIDKKLCILYWVDINKSILYQYDIKADQLVKTFYLVDNPSCILSASYDSLIYVDRTGVKRLDLKGGAVTVLSTHPFHNSELFRANDGTLLSDGGLLYGTMSFIPENSPGKIYYRDCYGITSSYEFGIHIPNTFTQIGNNILISDSLKKCIYALEITSLQDGIVELKEWKDLSTFEYTPDGGCLSYKGNLHIALWNGAAVAIFNKHGEMLKLIKVPVLKPTNCEIYNNRWLYVTSAREGMTAAQLKQYPLSGNTLVVDLGDNYEY